jgi:TolA-binding protein
MRKILVLLLCSIVFMKSGAQTGLYQKSEIKSLDFGQELFDKHLFNASKYEFQELNALDLESNQKVLVDFYYAISILKSEEPQASDVVYNFLRSHPNHPKANDAAHLLGNFFFEKKNYKEAIPAFKKVNLARVDEIQKSEVLFKTGYAYFQLKDFQNSLHFFNQVKNINGEYRADAFYYAGYIAYQSPNYPQAILDFKEADKSNFYSNKVPYMLAAIYYNQAQYDDLINYGEGVLASRRNLEKQEQIQLYLAEAYFEKRNFTKAAANFDAFVIAKKGDLSPAQVYKAGVAQFETQNFARATDYFKVVASRDDAIGQVSSYYLGHAYIKVNNPQFAINSFLSASKSEADSKIKEEALFNYAKINLEKGNFQDAINALDNYLDAYSRGKYFMEAEGLITDALINTNNYLRAIEQIEKMSKKSDRVKNAYQRVTFYQGLVYYRDKRHDLANTYFDKSLANPLDKDLEVETYFWKGENFAANNNLSEAANAYEKLQAARPGTNNIFYLKSLYGLGYSYFNLNQYNKAEVQFRSFVDRMQNYPDKEQYDDALIRLGDVFYVQKKFDEAANTFRRAVREGNKSTDYSYYRLGVVLNFQNKNNDAISELNQVINKFPNSLYFEDALYQKSQINMEETRYAEARDGFTQLINSRPNSPFIPYALEGRAVANFSLRNYDQTINDYKKILENHPNAGNGEAAIIGLQEALALQNRSAEFSQYLSRYRNANPSSQSIQNLEYETAKNLFFSNNFDQAIKAFQEFNKNYPQSGNITEALYFIADAQYKLGRKDQALNSFYQIEKERESAQRSRAVQRIAAIELENKNYVKAIPFLKESAKLARNKIEEYEANRGLMQAYFYSNKYDSTVVYSDVVIGLGAISVDAIPEAILFKSKSYLNLKSQAKAQETLMNLVNEYKTVHGAEGLYLLAEIFSQKKNYVQSNETIFDFSNSFSAHDYWYGRIFILLAENYINLGEKFQAKATLESVAERSTNEQIRSMAKQKLNNLN